MTEAIRLNSHAKLNLSLEIVGKRKDGYHDIVSFMQGIELCDTLEIKKCAGNGTKYNLHHCTISGLVVYLCTNENTIPSDMNNLALKGIAAFLEELGAKDKLPDSMMAGDCSLMVELDKRLPVAAGIAGGSGNAATAMLGINAIAGYPLSMRELMDIGAGVGADVPFSIFMNVYRNIELMTKLKGAEEACDAAWVTGIGEIVEPARALPHYVIMANPGISVSTAHAYRAMDEIGYGGSEHERMLFVNELEKYTLAEYPKAAALKEWMDEMLSADKVLMSGSGPTIVAYYRDKNKAEVDFCTIDEYASADPKLSVWLTSTGIAQEEALQI